MLAMMEKSRVGSKWLRRRIKQADREEIGGTAFECRKELGLIVLREAQRAQANGK